MPHCVGLVVWYVGDVSLLRVLAIKTCMIYVVPASKTVHQVVMFLDIVTERLLLIVALSWVMALLTSILPLLVWWLVVGHVGTGSKILLPLLPIWIVILVFLFTPFTRVRSAASSTMRWALWYPMLLLGWHSLCFMCRWLECDCLWWLLSLECWCRRCEICIVRRRLRCVSRRRLFRCTAHL